VVRSFSITTTYGTVERALVAFHCYAGGYKNQAAFTAAFPNKEVYFTECTGYVHPCIAFPYNASPAHMSRSTIGSGFWSDIKVQSHLFVCASVACLS
jgi:hypothetical protein